MATKGETFTHFGTACAAAMMVTALLSGRIFSRFAVKQVMKVSSIALTVSFFCYSLASSIWVFYLISAVLGLALGTVHMVPLSILLSNWFHEKRGFALGLALQDTGLAKNLIGSIPFAEWSPFPLMVGTGIICLFMATFMSHTATASLLIPIIAVVGVNMGDNLAPMGGVTALLVSVAFASSLGMSLPISTPPNALAYATGLVSSRGMAISGVILGILGMILTYVMMMILAQCHAF